MGAKHRLNKKFDYTCQFTGISATNYSVSQIAQLTWCTETLEVYGVNACSEFPNIAYRQMAFFALFCGYSFGCSLPVCGLHVTLRCQNQINTLR